MPIPPLFAHRLGRSYGPDSSAQALAGALVAGADGLETDVCLTSDEGLVLLHDPLLPLGTTLEGWASERTLAEIQRGWLRDRGGEATDQRPMTLDELMDAVPSEMPVQVEVKAHADPDLAVRTADVLCDRYRLDPVRRRIEVISFHSAACAAAAARGFRARLVIHADYVPEALAVWAVRHGVHGISIEHFLLSPKLVSTLRLAQLSITTGTVNDPRLLARVAGLAPLDGVCTDRPAELRAGIERILATGSAVGEPMAVSRNL
jgi:glycerophosphoryl diester phosphodiesterase